MNAVMPINTTRESINAGVHVKILSDGQHSMSVIYCTECDTIIDTDYYEIECKGVHEAL